MKRERRIDQDTQKVAKEQEARTAIDQSTDMMRKDQFTPGMDNETTRLSSLYKELLVKT